MALSVYSRVGECVEQWSEPDQKCVVPGSYTLFFFSFPWLSEYNSSQELWE